MIGGVHSGRPDGLTRQRAVVLSCGVFVAFACVGFLIVYSRLSAGAAPLPLAPDALEIEAARQAKAAPVLVPTTAAPAEFERITGIRIVRLTVTADGGLLDLRYTVLDPEKVAAHDAHGHAIGVVHAGSDSFLADSFHGPGHEQHTPDNPRSGQAYYLLFANPAGLVRPGVEVSVRFGHSELTGVRVE